MVGRPGLTYGRAHMAPEALVVVESTASFALQVHGAAIAVLSDLDTAAADDPASPLRGGSRSRPRAAD